MNQGGAQQREDFFKKDYVDYLLEGGNLLRKGGDVSLIWLHYWRDIMPSIASSISLEHHGLDKKQAALMDDFSKIVNETKFAELDKIKDAKIPSKLDSDGGMSKMYQDYQKYMSDRPEINGNTILNNANGKTISPQTLTRLQALLLEESTEEWHKSSDGGLEMGTGHFRGDGHEIVQKVQRTITVPKEPDSYEVAGKNRFSFFSNPYKIDDSAKSFFESTNNGDINAVCNAIKNDYCADPQIVSDIVRECKDVVTEIDGKVLDFEGKMMGLAKQYEDDIKIMNNNVAKFQDLQNDAFKMQSSADNLKNGTITLKDGLHELDDKRKNVLKSIDNRKENARFINNLQSWSNIMQGVLLFGFILKEQKRMEKMINTEEADPSYYNFLKQKGKALGSALGSVGVTTAVVYAASLAMQQTFDMFNSNHLPTDDDMKQARIEFANILMPIVYAEVLPPVLSYIDRTFATFGIDPSKINNEEDRRKMEQKIVAFTERSGFFKSLYNILPSKDAVLNTIKGCVRLRCRRRINNRYLNVDNINGNNASNIELPVINRNERNTQTHQQDIDINSGRGSRRL